MRLLQLSLTSDIIIVGRTPKDGENFILILFLVAYLVFVFHGVSFGFYLRLWQLKSWFFFYRLHTQLHKLRSQLRGSFFIWFSFPLWLLWLLFMIYFLYIYHINSFMLCEPSVGELISFSKWRSSWPVSWPVLTFGKRPMIWWRCKQCFWLSSFPLLFPSVPYFLE